MITKECSSGYLDDLVQLSIQLLKVDNPLSIILGSSEARLLQIYSLIS